MIDNDRIQYYLNLKNELPNVEFKGPGNKWDNPLFGRVVRTAIGMANRPGGGTIIIGVAEGAIGLDFVGLPDGQLKTWKYEEIADGFNSYAEPPIQFEKNSFRAGPAHYWKTFVREVTGTWSFAPPRLNKSASPSPNSFR